VDRHFVRQATRRLVQFTPKPPTVKRRGHIFSFALLDEKMYSQRSWLDAKDKSRLKTPGTPSFVYESRTHAITTSSLALKCCDRLSGAQKDKGFI